MRGDVGERGRAEGRERKETNRREAKTEVQMNMNRRCGETRQRLGEIRQAERNTSEQRMKEGEGKHTE